MTTDPNNQAASDWGKHDMVLPARPKTARTPRRRRARAEGPGACRDRRPSIDRLGRCIWAARRQAAAPLADRQQRTTSAVMRDAVAGLPARP